MVRILRDGAIATVFSAPALYSYLTLSAPLAWVLSSGVSGLVLVKMASSPKLFVKVLAATAATMLLALSWLFMLSYYFQGEGFNEQFFYHLDLTSLLVGFEQYPGFVIAAVLQLVICLMLLWVCSNDGTGGRWLATVFIVSLFLFSPGTSLVSFLIQDPPPLHLAREMHREKPQVVVKAGNQKLKNLVLIYAESLEQAYFDNDLFPELLPELSALRRESVSFDNIIQVRGTGWTMAGILASQCAIPLNVKYHSGNEGHTALAAVENPFNNEICLGDILASYGYTNIFMGGASKNFAGKGNFFSTHGFAEVLGREELLPQLTDKKYRTGWGLYDDTLLELAASKLEKLNASAPFMLSILTLDTHQPDGHASRSCEAYGDGSNSMLNAVHCSDQLLSKFIREIRQNPLHKNTVVMLVSDHLANRNLVYEKLLSSGSRRLTWFVWDGALDSGSIQKAGTHFDIGPTTAELIGIPDYSEFNFGSSLLGNGDSFWHRRSEVDPDATFNRNYFGSSIRPFTDGFTIDAAKKVIKVGEHKFKVSRSGFDMDESVFSLVIDEDGVLSAITSHKTVAKFLAHQDEFSAFISVSSKSELLGTCEREAQLQTGVEGGLVYVLSIDSGKARLCGRVTVSQAFREFPSEQAFFKE